MKQTLVLLPGLMCDRTVWEHQIASLADIANSLCMEWGPQHTSLVQMAEATLAVAPEKFALAGHSMGGRVAFEVYRLAPERVTHMAVMNTGVGPLADGAAGEEERAGRMRLLGIAKADGMRAMAQEWLKGMLPASRLNDEPLVNEIIEMFARRTATEFEIQQMGLLGRPDARPVLATIQRPTLVLTGQDDGWSGPARHEEIAAGIRDSKLVLVPECGHMSTMERPDEVTAAMRDWLKR